MQHRINVSNQHCAVQVYQMANHVWIADGEFLGAQLRARGSTAGKAVSAWRRAAVKRPQFSKYDDASTALAD